MVGLMHNPNVGGIVLMAVKHASGSSYKNMSIERYAAEAEKTGKPFSVVYLSDCGGSYAFLGETLRITREMVVKVSQFRRSICPLSALILGVKCGTSDATSGIAGNPCVGAVYDRVIKAGGTGFWSETTEIIGAEDIVAARAKTPEVGQKILEAARYWEEKAKSTGEDIRKINPIPANIAAGISTLEEKSLGAIAKGGTTEICGVLKYGERPPSHGLYFIDSWMSSLSLPLCFAASGAAIVLYQMGGGSFSENYPMMPAINPTVVSPFLYVTGNAKAYEKSPDNFDFNSSGIMLGTQTIEQAGELLLDHLLDIASGTFTKMEALNYAEQLEVFMEGPVL
jgi:altronate dehydratase large subunit